MSTQRQRRGTLSANDRLALRMRADELVRRVESGETPFLQVYTALGALLGKPDGPPRPETFKVEASLAAVRAQEMVAFWKYVDFDINPSTMAVSYTVPSPQENGRVLSNRKMRAMRRQGWELFYLPNHERAFAKLDQCLCGNEWGRTIVEQIYKQEGGYWFWAKTSAEALLSEHPPEDRLDSAMTLFEYLAATQSQLHQHRETMDRDTSTAVRVTEKQFYLVSRPAKVYVLIQGHLRDHLAPFPRIGWREVIRLVP